MYFTGGRYQPVGTRELDGTQSLMSDAFPLKLHPRDADVFIGYSTTEGQITTIDAQIGSTFFQELAECIRENFKNKCLDKMFTMVTNVVARDTINLRDFGQYMHVPQKVSMLRHPLYFRQNPLIRVRGRPDMSTFFSYEITCHKGGRG